MKLHFKLPITPARFQLLVLEYLVATVHGKLRSGRADPFVKVEGSFDYSFVCFQCEHMSQVQLEAFFLVQNACTAFPSTLVSMLELFLPLPILLLVRVAGLSGLNTIIVLRLDKESR
jgi:hypothetical protein